MQPRRMDRSDKVTGSIERVTFHNAETGFSVLRIGVRGARDEVTVVGVMPEPRPGEWLDAEGQWVVDKTHGRQFKAVAIRTATPNTREGIERYLASGLIKGIGEKLAGRLVDRYGEQVLEIIDQAPRKLLKIEGIGPERLQRIRDAWAEQRTVRSIMLFLHSHGVSTSRSHRIYKQYGDDAIERVTADPYCLARDIRGIGFKSADRIAERVGIARDSILRAKAGVEHALQELTGEGHCAYPRTELARRTSEALDIPPDRVEQALADQLDEGRIVRDTAGDEEELIYLEPLHRAETELADDLVGLLAGLHPCPPIDIPKAVAWVERKAGLSLADQQRDAVCMAATAKVMVVTGGPGVGKTTLVNSILKIFAAKGLSVVLCAPTGRAAKRLGETTGMEAKTIHRLLEWEPATGSFKHNARNPLDGDAFVVDEASMLDLPLAAQVVRAVPRHAALILVGDVDQLPSVGPGSVLRDVIDSGAVPVCRLTEVFRQAAASQIIANAHRINRGDMPDLTAQAAPGSADAPDFFFVKAEEPDRAVELIVEMVRTRIPQRFGHDPLDGIQVITPMHRGALGARHLNEVLQAALNPGGRQVERYGQVYRLGDKVMQTVNNYDKDVFNGDIGRIVDVDADEGELAVRFDRRTVRYALSELDELSLSYAITVHKSQGSEYPVVIVPVHTQHYVMLQRNLIYTAVTRSRELVVLVGTERAVGLAVRRAATRARITTLRSRLAAAAGKADRTGILPMRFR